MECSHQNGHQLSTGRRQFHSPFTPLSTMGRLDKTSTVHTPQRPMPMQSGECNQSHEESSVELGRTQLGEPQRIDTTKLEQKGQLDVSSSVAQYQHVSGGVKDFPAELALALEQHKKTSKTNPTPERRGASVTSRDGRNVIFRHGMSRQTLEVGSFRLNYGKEYLVANFPSQDGHEAILLGQYCYSRGVSVYVDHDGTEWSQSYYHIWTNSSDNEAHVRSKCSDEHLISKLIEKDKESTSTRSVEDLHDNTADASTDDILESMESAAQPSSRELKRLQSHNKPGRQEHVAAERTRRCLMKRSWSDSSQYTSPAQESTPPRRNARRRKKARESKVASENTVANETIVISDDSGDEFASRANLGTAQPTQPIVKHEPCIRLPSLAIPIKSEPTGPVASQPPKAIPATAPQPQLGYSSAVHRIISASEEANIPLAEKENAPPQSALHSGRSVAKVHKFVFKASRYGAVIHTKDIRNCKSVIMLFNHAQHKARIADADTGVLMLYRPNGEVVPMIVGDREDWSIFMKNLEEAPDAEEIIVTPET